MSFLKSSLISTFPFPFQICVTHINKLYIFLLLLCLNFIFEYNNIQNPIMLYASLSIIMVEMRNRGAKIATMLLKEHMCGQNFLNLLRDLVE